MEKTVLISLCSLFFLGFTLNSHTIQNQKTENTSTPTEIVNVEATVTDSIPSKGTYMIHKKTDKQDISIQVEDGDIKELHVDGKEIKPDDFNQYGEVIDELFGSMEAPPSAEGFNFMMPAMPPMPEMPDMPPSSFSFTMPPMPPMPAMGMNEMELEYMLGNGSNLDLLKENNLNNYLRDQMGSLMCLSDTLDPIGAKIIIIRNGDSTVIVSPNIQWAEGSQAPTMDRDIYIQNNDNWKQQQKAWKEQEQDLKKYWEENGENWKNNCKEQQAQIQAEQEKMHSERDRMRAEGDRIREESRGKMNSENYDRALQDELRGQGYGEARSFSPMARRMNMTDALIGEGLVQPGEEADILLTPDKLKINGKKMPENIHQKYLKMYEEQQGVELSGNSRVEFKTKSRRSM